MEDFMTASFKTARALSARALSLRVAPAITFAALMALTFPATAGGEGGQRHNDPGNPVGSNSGSNSQSGGGNGGIQIADALRDQVYKDLRAGYCTGCRFPQSPAKPSNNLSSLGGTGRDSKG
jgi:hypothetical protein